MKNDKKEKAIKLREQGWAITDIAKELGISKSTSFNWTRKIQLNEEQLEKLRHRETPCFRTKNDIWAIQQKEKFKTKRLEYQSQGRKEIIKTDWEHAAGCMLFWGEGSKSKNTLQFTNCDESMILFFVKFIKKFYQIENKDIAINFQYHNGGKSPDEIFDYWINFLEIEGCKKTKPYCKEKKSSKTKYENGVCRITICNTEVINRIWGSIQEYIGFNNPEYLK
jgi:hypothetical protein